MWLDSFVWPNDRITGLITFNLKKTLGHNKIKGKGTKNKTVRLFKTCFEDATTVYLGRRKNKCLTAYLKSQCNTYYCLPGCKA